MPSSRGTDIDYGLDGFDDASAQTLKALLGLPFRSPGKKPAGVPPEVA